MRCAWRLLASSAILLTGCSISSIATQSSVPDPVPAKAVGLQGKVHGGPPQLPLVGANVYLFAVSTGGYGTASSSLLKSTSNTHAGTYGNYVTTNSSGVFSIASTDYTCTSGQQLYLYSISGNPQLGSGNNTAAGLMAVLGDCSNVSSLPATIQLNEVTTVAAAYALAGYATDATDIAANSTTPLAGIKNAAANAGNLVSLSTGQALATTPGGNGSVPQAEINSLANILAACVNSTGSGSAGCTGLFNNALDRNSVKPTNTATAAINIAQDPGVNVTPLYNVALTYAQFMPALAAAPTDWTIAVAYTANSLNGVTRVAIDGLGNVWVTNADTSSTVAPFVYAVTKLSPLGADLSGTNGYTGNGSISQPNGIAIDTNNNAWIGNYADSAAASSLTAINNTGGSLAGSPYSGNGLNGPFNVAIDGSGDVWVANADTSSLSEFSSTGAAKFNSASGAGGLDVPDGIAFDPATGDIWVANADGLAGTSISRFSSSGAVKGSSPYTGNGLSGPIDIAIDNGGDVWVVNYNAGISGFDMNGNVLTGISPVTGGGLNGPYSIAIDGANNLWVANYGPENGTTGSISEFDVYGDSLSPNGYFGTLVHPVYHVESIAVDGSGNVWVADNGNGDIVEFVGVGTPAVTPLALAVKNSALGALP